MNKFYALLLAFLGFVSLILVGCGGGGGDSGGSTVSGGGGTSNSTSSNYSIAGTINDNTTGQHLSGVTVTLTSESSPATKYSASTTTSGEGLYELKDIPPGNYVMRISLNGYLSKNMHFPVKSNFQNNMVMLNLNDWNKSMGDSNHPYDPNSGYFDVAIANPTPNSQGVNEAVEGAKIACSPQTYSAMGYQEWGFINWNGTATTSFGRAFFYKVPVGQTYTLSISNAGASYSDILATPTAGEETQYNFYYYPVSKTSESAAISKTDTPVTRIIDLKTMKISEKK